MVNVVGSKEFSDDEYVHKAEETPKDDDSSNDLSPELRKSLEVDGVRLIKQICKASESNWGGQQINLGGN